MSRSKKDKRGGHRHLRYDRENWVYKQITKRKRRRAGNEATLAPDDERKIPPPERSTGGWLTW